MNRCLMLVVAGLISAFPVVARSDVVRTTDGRVLEGRILEETQRSIRIDVKLGWSRAVIDVPRAQLASVERKELPAGFWERQGDDVRTSKDSEKGFTRGQTPYLEVPIVGRVGEQVFVESIARSLRYARSRGIRHLVFTIDSVADAKSDDTEQALEIYKLLKRFADDFHYHGLVRNCIGDALAVTLWCDTVRLLPDARIGGMLRPADAASSSSAASERAMLRYQMALQAIDDTESVGVRADLIHAMLDTDVELYIWRDEKKLLRASAKRPGDVPRKDLLLEVTRGTLLQLRRDDAVAIGMPAFEGGAAALGTTLGVRGWVSAGDYGARITAQVQGEVSRREKSRQRAFERRAERLITRRATIDEFVSSHLAQAARFDPTKNPYDAYRRRWYWDWGWEGVRSGSSYGWYEETSQTIPRPVQRQWKKSVDDSIRHIREAARGLRALEKLDAEARQMGIETIYLPGEVATILADLQKKMELLASRRDPFDKRK